MNDLQQFSKAAIQTFHATDYGVLAPRMGELRYGNEIAQTLGSEFAGGLSKHISRTSHVGVAHYSHIMNLLGQPLLAFTTLLAGKSSSMSFQHVIGNNQHHFT
jgi:hypothetical protein